VAPSEGAGEVGGSQLLDGTMKVACAGVRSGEEKGGLRPPVCKGGAKKGGPTVGLHQGGRKMGEKRSGDIGARVGAKKKRGKNFLQTEGEGGPYYYLWKKAKWVRRERAKIVAIKN